MDEIDTRRRKHLAAEKARYQDVLRSTRATSEFMVADGAGPLLDVRNKWIAALGSKVENLDRLIALIDRDDA
jgi:hypothetical protein